MATGYLLGIDVGTTNTKAVVYDPEAGKVVAVASRPTVTHHSKPEWSEYDPAEIWAGVVGTIREATAGLAKDIRSVAVGSMCEAGVPIDREGRYLYPIIAWYDPRSEPQSRRWHDWLGERRVFEITGQQIQPKYSASKLLWLRDNEPEVLARMHKWLCMQDFVVWKLSGQYATDFSVASRTMAFDQRRLTWSEEILDRIGLGPERFPTPYQAGTAVGEVSAGAAAETGLPAGAVVAAGGHDHLCGSFAAGIIGPGSLLNSMGTAEACLFLTDSYTVHEGLVGHGYSHYAHVIPGHYVVHFGLVSSGGFLEWLVQRLCGEACETPEGRQRSFDSLLAAAAEVSPGSQGLFWLPYLNGGTTPWNDTLAKASLIGLAPAHGRGHIVRAALEGLCFWVRENLETIAQAIEVPARNELAVIGGSTRAELWMRIKADVTGRPVRVVEVPEAVAVGAALLGGVGAGVFPNHEAAAASVVRTSRTYEPDPERVAQYSRYYEAVYKDLFPTLRALNLRIHDLFWSEGKLT